MRLPATPTSGAVSRRTFATAIGAAAACAAWPAAAAPTTDGAALRTKRLIVLTLFGGNDSLNTLVPYNDPLYRRLRPTLALPRGRVLTLDDELALHPALTALARMYESAELAIVPDVGYPQPDLSHFESSAIWDSAERKPDARIGARTGWWAKVVAQNRASFDAAGLDAAAISFEDSAAFAAGSGVPVLQANRNIGALFAPALPAATPSGQGAARELARMVADADAVRLRVTARLRTAARPVWRPTEGPLHVQCRLTEWLLAQGVAAPLVRMELGGFDHHTQLLPRHGDLMTLLDRELAELRDRLRASGLWQDTVVLVHSEFGRRPQENGFAGADHGSGGPVLLMGGSVRGGIFGKRADLGRLDAAGNTPIQADFRALYASVVSALFRLPVNPFLAPDIDALTLTLA